MHSTADPALEAFRQRDDRQFLTSYMAAQERASQERRERERERGLRALQKLLRERQKEPPGQASDPGA
jgi:hypothetical protein